MTPSHITTTVTTYLSVTEAELTSPSREAHIVHARHICMALIRAFTRLSQEATGQLFNRDHSTVVHAIKTVHDRIETDQAFELEYYTITNKVIEKHIEGMLYDKFKKQA